MNQKKFFIASNIFLIFAVITSCNCNSHIAEKDDLQAAAPDIANPGPDTASFPVSPFTLPKGRAYFENFPLTFEMPSNTCSKNNIDHSYNWSFLLRIAVTNFLEFRLIGQGLTHLYDSNITGFSPLGLGVKAHLWGNHEWRLVPSGGIEAYIVTPIASKKLRDDTQFIINTLFNHKFSESLALEWNLGLYSCTIKPCKKRSACLLINWSLQKEITNHIGLFFEGLYSTNSYPFYPANLLLGAGFISTLTKRICIYGSYNWAVFPNRNPDMVNAGFALAF